MSPPPSVLLAATAMLAALVADTAIAQPNAPARVEKRVVTYAEGRVGIDATKPLMLDLYFPPAGGTALRAAIIAIHGGSFRSGARDISEQVQFGEALASRGFVVASIQYRLQNDAPRVAPEFQPYAKAVLSATYQPTAAAVSSRGRGYPLAVAAATEDAAAALNWVYLNAAALGVDRTRISLLGASAGAMTALNLAYLSNDYGVARAPVAAVVDLRGMILDDRRIGARPPLQRDEPPLFIVHGTNDDRVTFTEALRLYDLARRAHIAVEFHPIAGIGHDLGGATALNMRLDTGELLIDRLVRFLRRASGDSRAVPVATCIGAGAACPPGSRASDNEPRD